VYDTCVGCTADYGAGGFAQCPTSTSPFCDGTGADGGTFDGGDGGLVGPGGTCGTCTNNGGDVACASATAVHTGTKCAASGACALGCATDTACKPSEFCEGQTGACTAKIADGMPLPSGDTCDSVIATRECVSAMCDPATNLCGAPPPPAFDASAQGDATVAAEGGSTGSSAPVATYTVGGGCACDVTGSDSNATWIGAGAALVAIGAAFFRRGSRSRDRASSSRSRAQPPST
jgi:MYXO-CTERM domain-containing protein